MKLWEVEKSKYYPDGVKYSLIFIDSNSNKKILMDNHKPKSHHYHIDNKEFHYFYKGEDQLIKDFKLLVKTHIGIDL